MKEKGGSAGALFIVLILAIIIAFTNGLVGGITPKNETPSSSSAAYACCDSGSGADCHPNNQKQLTYNGQTYGLLKSNIYQKEPVHTEPTEQYSPAGDRIFINISDRNDYVKSHPLGPLLPGCQNGMDFIAGGPEKPPGEPYFGGYFCVPDDEIIYVCRNGATTCKANKATESLPFDVYFRLSDGAVPNVVSTMCPKPDDTSKQSIINTPPANGKKNLQLETFNVETPNNRWFSAWCKPAINLYPTQKSDIHVEVKPVGKFTQTIPLYPMGGWDVSASPDGEISYNSASYPYLYWEAAIPDKLLNIPQSGYVTKHQDLSQLFHDILPKLGLNEREQLQFTKYWLKALPASPYYFVGVMPERDIDSLAPLSIQPVPDSTLRVALYFKALDKPVNVTPPHLPGFKRRGFTVTEWGGFFKADKNHPNFTCMM